MKVLALDVGEKRIGVAKADSSTRIAVPVGFINVDGLEWQEIAKIARLNNTNFFVLGLPRSNEGNETAQSLYVRQFAKTLVEKLPDAKIRFQDESLTSVLAEERLKSRKKRYEKGEIDAEAASIILQDFLESFTVKDAIREGDQNNDESTTTSKAKATIADAKNLTKKEADRVKLNTKKAKHKLRTVLSFVVLPLLVLLIIGGVGGFVWAKSTLGPVNSNCKVTAACKEINFVVGDGESKATIADNLEQAKLIQNSFVFKMYLQIFKSDINLKSGEYIFNQGMSADEIIDSLAKGADDKNTFTFTILPGETIFDVKNKLIGLNYSLTEIEEAFNASYDFDFLSDRPEGASLEGYLYGETHEFYKHVTVKEIVETFLKGTEKVITENSLVERYAEQGLSLYEGITLASVIQKEAPTSEMQTVAQVFLSRLDYGIPLGSDVTVSYALDTIDPDRQTYIDNETALSVDSCYNTRVYAGLPCGPISNPGLSALLAVAEPSNTSYLYFLTGDDGMMYYGYTEEEHIQNIYSHCQELCNISL